MTVTELEARLENMKLKADMEELRAIHEALRASVEAAPKGDRYQIVLEPRGLEWRAVVKEVRPGGLCFATGTPAYVADALRQEMVEYDRRREEAGCEQAEEAPRGRPVEAGPVGGDGDNHYDIPATVKAIHARIEGVLRRLEKLEERLNHRDRAYDRLHEAVARMPSNHKPAGSPA